MNNLNKMYNSNNKQKVNKINNKLLNKINHYLLKVKMNNKYKDIILKYKNQKIQKNN